MEQRPPAPAISLFLLIGSTRTAEGLAWTTVSPTTAVVLGAGFLGAVPMRRAESAG